MYHFLSGYTAKVAGTEVGVTEPQATFSACFGAPFMPLPPTEYAEMLAEKVQQHGVRIWLVNTGWTGGGYGAGTRMKLKYTRAMIRAAMNGALDGAAMHKDPVFGLHSAACPSVPDEVLIPAEVWKTPRLIRLRWPNWPSCLIRILRNSNTRPMLPCWKPLRPLPKFRRRRIPLGHAIFLCAQR